MTSSDLVMETLVRLFAECREEDITIPPNMPLDTYEHQCCAVRYLSNLIRRKRRGDPFV